MSSTNDPIGAPFHALRVDDTALVAPDPGFAQRLRRELEAAATPSAIQTNPTIPTIDLPTPKDTTMDMTPAVQIVTPYISVHDGAAALDWYTKALGAIETVRYVGDDGRLGHAEFLINGGRIMLSDAYPEMGVVAANSYEGSSCALHVEVADCDAIHDQAVAAGATSLSEPADQPHGARSATLMDPFGHRWMLSQQKSSPSSEEIADGYGNFEVIEADGSTG